MQSAAIDEDTNDPEERSAVADHADSSEANPSAGTTFLPPFAKKEQTDLTRRWEMNESPEPSWRNKILAMTPSSMRNLIRQRVDTAGHRSSATAIDDEQTIGVEVKLTTL